MQPPETLREPRRSSPSLPGAPGWTPAHTDHTPDAVAWRAAHAVAEAAEARQESANTRQELATLRASVDRLDATLNTVNGAVRSFLRWVLGIATAVVIAGLIGAGAIAWRWVSTLHH
jgi:hypothetical protein